MPSSSDGALKLLARTFGIPMVGGFVGVGLVP